MQSITGKAWERLRSTRSTFEEGAVTSLGGDGIDRVRDPAEFDRGPNREVGVWTALLLITVEELVTGPTTENEMELPRQVGRIADAGAGALPEIRRHRVCGVAGEEDTTHPPSICDPACECVPEIAQRLQVRRCEAVRCAQPIPG